MLVVFFHPLPMPSAPLLPVVACCAAPDLVSSLNRRAMLACSRGGGGGLFLLIFFFFSLSLLLPEWAHCFSPSPQPPPDALALLSFKSNADPLGSRLRFSLAANHCRWIGVECSGGGRVVRLVVEDLGLNGTLAPGTISRLYQLRVLSLKSNSLHGTIPPDLANLTSLKALYLAGNLFSGAFPTSLLSLHRLRTLDLSHNNISGPIPAGLAALGRLSYLRLDSNRLNGSLPPFNQSSLAVFNVSFNDLSGPVPATSALAAFGISSFAGNPSLCGMAVGRECRSNFQFFHGRPLFIAPSPADPGLFDAGMTPSPRRMHKREALTIGLLGGAFLLIGLTGCLSFSMWKKRMRRDEKFVSNKSRDLGMHVENHSLSNGDANAGNVDNNGGGGGNSDLSVSAAAMVAQEDKVKKLGKSGSLVFCAGEAHLYTLEQLMRASAEMLGRGTVGTTYKAVLDCQLIVSVKRVDAARLGTMGKESFHRHLDMVGGLRHPNLVSLRAYFHAKEERLLVYDYQPNGSLFSLIHGSRSNRAKPLHWTSCLKIAEDVAQGLSYIHQASRLVHGNIKSTNVLLGSDFEACLADNCLSLLAKPSDRGDSGYQAPETRKLNCRPTQKSDIYAFGVLLLELLTGKPPLQHPVLVSTDLPLWIRSLRDDGAREDEHLMMLVDIAASCIQLVPESRPTAWQVIKMIQEVKEVEEASDDYSGDADYSSLS